MNTRDLVLSALFAAIIIALGLLPPIMLGFVPVPITAQSLGVMLAGVVLGAVAARLPCFSFSWLRRSACRCFRAVVAGLPSLPRRPRAI